MFFFCPAHQTFLAPDPTLRRQLCLEVAAHPAARFARGASPARRAPCGGRRQPVRRRPAPAPVRGRCLCVSCAAHAARSHTPAFIAHSPAHRAELSHEPALAKALLRPRKWPIAHAGALFLPGGLESDHAIASLLQQGAPFALANDRDVELLRTAGVYMRLLPASPTAPCMMTTSDPGAAAAGYAKAMADATARMEGRRVAHAAARVAKDAAAAAPVRGCGRRGQGPFLRLSLPGLVFPFAGHGRPNRALAGPARQQQQQSYSAPSCTTTLCKRRCAATNTRYGL